MPPPSTVDALVYASHCQFYLEDDGASPDVELVWDGAALERHVGVVEGLLAVGTIGYCTLPVRIEVWPSEPPLDLEAWDHVVDVSVEVRTGRLVLGGVEGPADAEPIDVEPGWYRVRSAGAGLGDADEFDGGDRYRLQLWPARADEPAVRKWWQPWDPAAVVAQPTTPGGRLLHGAEAEDRRRRMRWLAARGSAHLFEEADGTLWEHSNLPDAAATPQLEELAAPEAEHRFGPRAGWGPQPPVRPSGGQMLRNVWAAWRSSRSRRR